MIDTLPDELLCAIFGHLPCLALRSAVPLVCRRWRDVAGDTMALQVRLCIDAARTMKRPARWCDAAAAAGHLHCLAHARYDIGLAWGATTCQSSSRAGHLDCLQFAHSNGCPWNHNTTRVAAANGHLDCFLYAIENQCPIQDEAMLAAARNGHADILDVIASETDDTVLDLRVCERAAVGGHLDLIQQLGRWHTVADGTALYGAVCAGHVAITRYLVEEHGLRHCPWGLWGAIKSGNVDIVRCLCDSLGLGDAGDLYAATAHCQKRVVLYLLGRGISVDNSTAKRIVKRGWTDVIDFVCATNPELVDHIAAWSIYYDRIQCLERALDHGAALDPDLVARAAGYGRITMIDLLVGRGLAWSMDAMHEAARNGHVEALARAKSAGLVFDADACMLAARNGHDETVRYLCNRRCPVDGRARAHAKVRGHHKIECYLADRGCIWDESEYRAELAVRRYCAQRETSVA
ncbi:ankyrin repeat protein [Pandoravirus inopinatum]|uniref:Ankyrin repeat protein n=1 Tax=Pandoravirus inopinatum TaxID=1605721 RepID=A0A0B5J6V8_9VIRU|nr:ankyrin repeat protein [Pandoravirus inopinatum]AJF97530.1 ankyrin repeat protein [Pandoravirus inopinatum]